MLTEAARQALDGLPADPEQERLFEEAQRRQNDMTACMQRAREIRGELAVLASELADADDKRRRVIQGRRAELSAELGLLPGDAVEAVNRYLDALAAWTGYADRQARAMHDHDTDKFNKRVTELRRVPSDERSGAQAASEGPLRELYQRRRDSAMCVSVIRSTTAQVGDNSRPGGIDPRDRARFAERVRSVVTREVA